MTPHWAWAACGHTPFASFPIQILTVSSLRTVITTPRLRYYTSIDSYGWAGIIVELACVASVSSRGSSRKLVQEQKNRNDGGGGGERSGVGFGSECSKTVPEAKTFLSSRNT